MRSAPRIAGLWRASAVLLVASLAASCGYNDPVAPAPPPAPPGEASTGEPIAVQPGVPVDLATAKRVHGRNSDALTNAWAGVTGHGVAAADGARNPRPGRDDYVISVFMRTQSAVPDHEYAVDGVRIEFVVTGEFNILPAAPAG